MANEQEQIKLQNTRRQRVRTQQGIISVFSILCLLFSCVWGVHAVSSKTVFFEPSDDSSQAEAAETKKKNVKKSDSSSKAEEESSEAPESQVSHDEGVHRIVHLLEELADEQGNGKGDDAFGHRAFSH